MKRSFAALAVLLAVAVACPADEKQAKATLEKAITAHGGPAALAAAARQRRTETGTLTIRGKAVPFVRKVTLDLPERHRTDVTVEKAVESLHVLDGDQAFANDGATTTDLN